jgi:GxxExxY protein
MALKYGDSDSGLTGEIIRAAIEVHNALGPGLLEKAYHQCLAYKLETYGFKFEVEKPVPVKFESVKIELGYKLDLLVEDKIVVEVKSVKELEDIHLAQVLTYLKLGNYKRGLLINFNVLLLKEGIKRVVNKYYQ